MMNCDIIQFCSIPIYKSTLNLDETIINYVENMDYERYKANNGFRTKDYYVLNKKEFSNLSDEIQKHTNNYLRNHLKISEEIQFKFTTSWISKHHRNDYSQPHIHKQSVFSGIVYLKTPESCGGIVFEKDNEISPSIFHFNFSEWNILNSSSWTFQPEKSDIFLFPSSLRHYTFKNMSNESRYCLVFNLWPVGKLSTDIEELILT